MRVYGRCTVHDFLGDFIVFRNLAPFDQRLPGLDVVRAQVGLPAGLIPRKSELAYAAVIALLLRAARTLEAPRTELARLIYLGDTRLNDGTAFANIARAGPWPGLAVIVDERDEPPHVQVQHEENRWLYVANRWSALANLASFCQEQGFPVDDGTAVVIDLDKTALGARGRNDRVIDEARVEAVQRTVGSLLGDDFDPASFRAAYDRLNQQEFHPFTADNQDYLAYICLILGAGLVDVDRVVARVQDGELQSFHDFIREVDARRGNLSRALQEIHRDVYDRVRAGDPTPFKTFRRQEYRATIERMGWMGDDAPVGELLGGEITVTQEVREAASWLKGQGALLFALSDKPDEASVPRADLAADGWLPIHRTNTHAVGGE
jgi:hypothetical protein